MSNLSRLGFRLLRTLPGSNPEPALALGRAAGLTRLEPSIRLLLGLSPAPDRTATPSRPN